MSRHRGRRRSLLADFWTVFFRKIETTKRAMKVHPGTQHVGINDKDLLASGTCHFDRLAHCSYLDSFVMLFSTATAHAQ
jgi:hypothetical protein